MPQVLHLLNGEPISRRISDGEGRLGRLLAPGRSDREVADQLFLASLGRRPTDAQWKAVQVALAEPGADRAGVFRDLVWAIVNSREFLFGH